jgi:hypothetical protein
MYIDPTVHLSITSQSLQGPFHPNSGTSSKDANPSRNSLRQYAHRRVHPNALEAAFSTRHPPQSIPKRLKHIHTIWDNTQQIPNQVFQLKLHNLKP